MMTQSRQTRIVYIANVKSFHEHFARLRESARGTISNNSHDYFLVGFDTEYVEGNPKKVCVIQMGTAELVLVIHVVHFGNDIPNQLLHAIQSPSWIKVGVGVGLDLHYLAQQYKLGHCSGGIDLRNVALVLRIPQTSLVALYNRFLKPIPTLPLKSHVGVFDWSLPTLPENKIKYAGQDAYMAYVIFKAMMQPLRSLVATQKYPSSSSLNLLDDEDDNETEAMTTDEDAPKPLQPDTTEVLLDIQQHPMQPPVQPPVQRNSSTQSVPSVMDTVVLAPQTSVRNYVGRLNEYAQRQRVTSPKYAFGRTFTDEHTCACSFEGTITRSMARSKKTAKQQASQLMLQRISSQRTTPTKLRAQSAVQRLEALATQQGVHPPMYGATCEQNTYGKTVYKVACGFNFEHVYGYGETEDAAKEAAAQKMLLANRYSK